MAAGFYKNAERQMEAIRDEVIRIDQTGTLSGEQEAKLLLLISEFKKKYGITLSISIQEDPLETVPRPAFGDVPYIMLWLSPKYEEVVLAMSPLVRISIGDPLAHVIGKEWFTPYFSGGNWPEGLAGALNALTAKLDACLLPETTGSRPAKNAKEQ